MKDEAYKSFVNPDKIYSGTDFWMLNGRLEDEELIRQLTEMKERGINSVIARTYVGLVSDYPGKDFKSKMRVILNTARSLDMKIYLQAGYMPDDVVGLPREYAIRSIKINKRDADVCSQNKVLDYEDYVVEYTYPSRYYLDIFNADSVDYYLNVSYNEMWREFEDFFGNTVISIWVDEPSIPGGALPFPNGIETEFFKKYGYSLTDNLIALFLDVPGYKTVRYHYRILLLELLENNYFKKLRDWCKSHGLMASGHLLFEETLESQIHRAIAVMPFYKYLDVSGIDVLNCQQNWRHREIKPISGEYRYREVMLTTPIQCMSVARQTGAEHVLCEMYGVTSEDFGFREQKHMFDYIASHGINHRSVHGIFYSLKGIAKRLYPPHVNYYQPYWNDLGIMQKYVSSVSRFVSLGVADKDILVIHPLDSAYCEYTAKNDCLITGAQPSSYAIKARDKNFMKLITSLTLNICAFDLGDERTIEDMGDAARSKFTVGNMRYSTVVLPELSVVRKSTLDKLKSFSSQGGRIIVLGAAPTMIDGIETGENILSDLDGVIYVENVSELIPLLKSDAYSLRQSDGGIDLILQRRTDAEREYYYVMNTDCSEEKLATLTLKGRVKVEKWCPITYKVEGLPCIYSSNSTKVDICVPEGGNLLLVAYSTDEDAVSVENKESVSYTLSERFEIERSEPNVYLLEFASFKRENGDYGKEYPILAVKDILTREKYRGYVTLKFKLVADEDFDKLSLALEDLSESKIKLNGEDIPAEKTGYYLDRSFETVSLPRVRKGTNYIELTKYFEPYDDIERDVASLFDTRRGTDLECMYILGDFAVNAISEPERSSALRYSRYGMSIGKEKAEVNSELTSSGYPFYAGTVAFKSRFTHVGKTDGFKLSLDFLDACLCRIELNGIDCGAVFSSPYELDVSNALKSGENHLTLHLTNTIRNLIGPYHRPDGDRGYVRGTYGNADIGWMGGVDADDGSWYEHRETDTQYWTDSYLELPFGVSGIRLKK